MLLMLDIFAIIGTIAFAVSGALLGIKKNLDFFGVTMLAITTAVGGGIIRDIAISNTPPAAFREPAYVFIAILAAIVVIMFYRRIRQWHRVIQVFDAIGLGAFTAMGAQTALNQEVSSGFIVVTLGVMTGIGGGILRDVFVGEIPLVFRKEIYAIASIIGAILLYYSNYYLGQNISLLICFLVTIFIRILSIYHNINLPVKIDDI